MGFEQKDQRQANMGRVDEVGGGDFKSATGGWAFKKQEKLKLAAQPGPSQGWIPEVAVANASDPTQSTECTVLTKDRIPVLEYI